MFSINFSKVNTKFCLNLHYNGDNRYLFVTGKETYKFKADYKNVEFSNEFCLGSISNKFGTIERSFFRRKCAWLFSWLQCY